MTAGQDQWVENPLEYFSSCHLNVFEWFEPKPVYDSIILYV